VGFPQKESRRCGGHLWSISRMISSAQPHGIRNRGHSSRYSLATIVLRQLFRAARMLAAINSTARACGRLQLPHNTSFAIQSPQANVGNLAILLLLSPRLFSCFSSIVFSARNCRAGEKQNGKETGTRHAGNSSARAT
jgi:hypothetical protein